MNQARATRPDAPGDDYHVWREATARLRGRDITTYSKPGMRDDGEADLAAALLADALEARGDEQALDLNCGGGLVGAVVAMLAPAGRVVMADSNIIAVEAARRTIVANGLTNAEARPSSGTSHLTLPAPVDLVTIRLPKGRQPALQLIWDAYTALKPGGQCYLAGANDEGIQPALRHAADLFGNGGVLAYRKGCRVGRMIKGAEPPAAPAAFALDLLDHAVFHEFSVAIGGKARQVCSRPGVFAWDRLDVGARALIETMEIGAGEAVLDLGCGYGIAGVVAAERAGSVTLVDVELEAVESACRTIAANGLANAEALLSDGAAAVRERVFDVVITNPPFHAGKATAYETARQFIRDAAAVLRPGGRLYLVANHFLPYETAIEADFGNVATAFADGRYKVLLARKQAPRAERVGRRAARQYNPEPRQPRRTRR